MTKLFLDNLNVGASVAGEAVAYDGSKWAFSDESHGVQHPAIISGWGPDTGAVILNANGGYFDPFKVDVPTTIKRMGVMVGNLAGTGDNVQLAIYDRAGTRLFLSDTFNPVATSQALVVDIDDQALDPGIYYAGFTTDNAGTRYMTRDSDGGAFPLSGAFFEASVGLPATIPFPATASRFFTTPSPAIFLLTGA